jgi:hypothetical protein
MLPDILQQVKQIAHAGFQIPAFLPDFFGNHGFPGLNETLQAFPSLFS